MTKSESQVFLKISISNMYFLISILKPTRCTSVSNLFCFGNDALHVSDSLSVHHQEFKTVRYIQQQVFVRYCCLLASGMDGKSVRNTKSVISKIK